MAFTINAAYVNGIDDRTGSLEAGKLADLIVADRNPFDVEPSEISEIGVILTLLEGEVVHGDLLTGASVATLDGDAVGLRVD